MSRMVQELNDIERMMQLGARPVLIKVFFTHTDAKIQQIKRSLKYDFDFKKNRFCQSNGLGKHT